eukprot:TRINITY_DN14655_c0_g1_i1.p1 TRINITY_DN14655_c0_g1~~TRINITY_DN14655_c0_g1_i1.p1  ORF type:complete len:247 (+),score=50.81 TRINITY_DN14655_c0_g1_i1:251-991(+)
MHLAKIEPDTAGFNALLRMWIGRNDYDKVNKLLDLLETSNVRMDSDTCSMAIDMYHKQDDVKKVQEVLDKMNKNGIPMIRRIYCSAIVYWAEKSQFDVVQQLLKELKDDPDITGNDKLDDLSYRAFVELFEHMKANNVPFQTDGGLISTSGKLLIALDNTTLIQLVLLGEEFSIDIIYGLLQSMEQSEHFLEYLRDISLFNVIFALYAKYKRLDCVQPALELMQRHGIKPNQLTNECIQSITELSS